MQKERLIQINSSALKKEESNEKLAVDDWVWRFFGKKIRGPEWKSLEISLCRRKALTKKQGPLSQKMEPMEEGRELPHRRISA